MMIRILSCLGHHVVFRKRFQLKTKYTVDRSCECFRSADRRVLFLPLMAFISLAICRGRRKIQAAASNARDNIRHRGGAQPHDNKSHGERASERAHIIFQSGKLVLKINGLYLC